MRKPCKQCNKSQAAMLAGDVTLLRNAYLAALDRAKGSTPLPAKGDGEEAA